MSRGTKVAENFPERSKSEIRQSDEHLAELRFGDQKSQMFSAWKRCGTCHLFLVGSSLFARGKKQEREFARGFVSGWRKALAAVIDDE